MDPDCKCAPSCTLDKLMNYECDEECNTEACDYDNLSCICPFCTYELRTNSKCDKICNTRECAYEEKDLCFSARASITCGEYCPYSLADTVDSTAIEPGCWTLGCKYLTGLNIPSIAEARDREYYLNLLRYNIYMQLIFNDLQTSYEPDYYCPYQCSKDTLLKTCEDSFKYICSTSDDDTEEKRIRADSCKQGCRSGDCLDACGSDNECKVRCNDCLKDCTSTKTECDESCNLAECAYDLGDCKPKDCPENCELCAGSEETTCLKCKENFILFSYECVAECIVGFYEYTIPYLNSKICLPIEGEEGYSIDNPMSLFVYLPGKTTEGFPNFISLSNALSEAYYDYTDIFLTTSTKEEYHLWTLASLGDSFSEPNEPFTFSGIAQPILTQIKPFYCSEHGEVDYCVKDGDRPVVKWDGLDWITIEVVGTLYIMDIELWGKNYLITDCVYYELYFYGDPYSISEEEEIYYLNYPEELDYCQYCPNFKLKSDYILTDRDESLDLETPFGEDWVCAEYNDKSLFKVQGKLKLENVKIFDWRSEIKSIIYNDRGDIELENVEFSNIIIASTPESGVIVSTQCEKNSYDCGSISYNGGEVNLLNNGFEYNKNLEFSGFLLAKGARSIQLDSVNFEYNLAYIGDLKSTTQVGLGSLIYATNFREFSVSNCVFDKNHVANGLINLGFSTTFNRNPDDISIIHISISDSIFTNNYGREVGAVKIEYKGEHLNAVFSNLVFSQNVVQQVAMIYAYLSGSFNQNWVKTVTKQIHPDKPKEAPLKDVVYSKRYIKFEYIEFDDNAFGGNGAIYIRSLANVMFNAILINNSQQKIPEGAEVLPSGYIKLSDGTQVKPTDLREEYVHKYFVESDLSYITKNIINPSSSIDSLYNPDYDQLGLIINPRGLKMIKVVLSNNYSKNGNTDINIRKALFSVQLQDIVILNNKCDGPTFGTGISISSVNAGVTVTNFMAKNNSNEDANGYGPLYINSKSDKLVRLKDSIFDSNSAASGAAATIFFKKAVIDSIVFKNNKVMRLYGTLYIGSNGSLPTCTLSITNTLFRYNLVSAGQGGALALDYMSIRKNSILDIIIDSCQFEYNTSKKDSAVIYVDPSVRLSSTSIISACSFENNTSEGKANIYLAQAQGVLTFRSCSFLKNKSSQGIAIYTVAPQGNNIVNRVELYKCILNDNIDTMQGAGSVIQLADTAVYSVVHTQFCTFIGNSAKSVYLEYGEWEDVGSFYYGNSAERGAVLHILSKSKATIRGAEISSNTVSEHGAVASISSQSHVIIDQSKIYKNSAKGYGGVIFVDQESSITLQDSIVYDNKAEKKASVIYSIGCDTIYSKIINTEIYNNTAYSQGAINLISSNMQMISSTLINNSASYGPMSIMVTLSMLEMDDCKILNQKGNQGGAIYATSLSDVKIRYSRFNNISVTGSGGFLFALSSNVTINTSTIENIDAESGAAIYLFTDCRLSVDRTAMINIRNSKSDGIIKVSESEVELSRSKISNFTMGGIDGYLLSNITISNTEIAHGTGTLVGGLTCNKCKNILISDSTFRNITSNEGGALNLYTSFDYKETNQYQITHSSFYENTADNGGAIITDNIQIKVEYSLFSRNLARIQDKYKDLNDTDYGCGGAMFLKCSDLDDCLFELIGNVFEFNSASRKGGSVYWTDIMPVDIANEFRNNYAVYASDIASYPVAVAMVDENGDVISQPDLHKRRMESSQVIANASSIASGQHNKNWTIRAAIIDHYGNVIRTDSSSFAQLEEQDYYTQISGITRVQAKQGIYIFDNFEVTALPGANTIISVRSDAIDDKKKEKAKDNTNYYTEVSIDVDLRDCMIGEQKLGNSCDICPYPLYSLTPDQECSECPSEAYCYGNFTMVPREGYWRVDKFTDKFFECPNRQACLGSPEFPDEISYSGECAEGYTGNLCQACDSGYSRSSKNKCGGCPSREANIVKLVGVGVAALGVIGIMVRSTMNSAYKPKAVHSIYIKILMNYLQLVMLAASFELAWPEQVLELFRIQESAGSVTDQVFSFDCFLAESGNKEDIDNVYFTKLVIFLIMPAILFLLALIFWAAVAGMYRKLKYLRDHFVATIIILLFLIHPNVIKVEFSAFNCFEIEPGEFWLRENLDIRCWSSKHTTYAVFVALPAIGIWGLGIPTLCLYFLRRYHKQLHTVNLKLKLGFLYNGYNYEYYYWEFVVLYRKISIICCSVFLVSISVHIQALTVMLVLFFFLFVQMSHNPYTHKSMNEMEVRSILVSTVTIYCGLYYLTNDLSNNTKFGFFLVIVGFNLYFLYYWLGEMFAVLLDLVTKLVPYFRKFRKRLYDGYANRLFVAKPLQSQVVHKAGEDLYTFLDKTFDDKPVGIIDMEKTPTLEREMVDLYMLRVDARTSYFENLKPTEEERLSLVSLSQLSNRHSETQPIHQPSESPTS